MKEQHPDNALKPDAQLISEAQDEMLTAIRRHFKHDPMVIRATIPTRADDTDVIVMDALARAVELMKERADLLEACKDLIAEIENGAIGSALAIAGVHGLSTPNAVTARRIGRAKAAIDKAENRTNE